MCEVKLHKVEAISIGPEGPEMTYLWIRNAHFRYKQPVINGTQKMVLVHNGPGPQWSWSKWSRSKNFRNSTGPKWSSWSQRLWVRVPVRNCPRQKWSWSESVWDEKWVSVDAAGLKAFRNTVFRILYPWVYPGLTGFVPWIPASIENIWPYITLIHPNESLVMILFNFRMCFKNCVFAVFLSKITKNNF